MATNATCTNCSRRATITRDEEGIACNYSANGVYHCRGMLRRGTNSHRVIAEHYQERSRGFAHLQYSLDLECGHHAYSATPGRKFARCRNGCLQTQKGKPMRLFKFTVDGNATCFTRVRPPGWTDEMRSAQSVTGEEIPSEVRAAFHPTAMEAFEKETGSTLHSAIVDSVGEVKLSGLSASSAPEPTHSATEDETEEIDTASVDGDIALD